MAQRQGCRGTTLEIAADKAIGRHAEIESGFGRVLDGRGAVFLCEGKQAEDAADAGFAIVTMDVIGEGAERATDALRGGEERDRLRRRARRSVRVLDAMPAARRAHVLTEQRAGLGIEQPDVEIIPVHIDAASDPSRRGTVVRGVDFDAAIEMHRADAEVDAWPWPGSGWDGLSCGMWQRS